MGLVFSNSNFCIDKSFQGKKYVSEKIPSFANSALIVPQILTGIGTKPSPLKGPGLLIALHIFRLSYGSDWMTSTYKFMGMSWWSDKFFGEVCKKWLTFYDLGDGVLE